MKPFPRPGLTMSTAILLSLAWGLLGLALALWVPWLGLAPAGWQATVNYGAPAVTVALILWNLVLSFRFMGLTGRALAALPLTLAQVVLFTLLFVQIACHQGAEHYAWDTPPDWRDWSWFTFTHAVRVVDLIDVLHAYGVNLQTFRHASPLAATALVGYHLVLGFFLLGLVLDGVRPVKRWLRRRLFGETEREASDNVAVVGFVVAVAFVAAWLVSALFVRPWQTRDMLLWPADNLLRVFDVADALELFDVRLHQVPATWWEGTLTFLCRLLMAVGLATTLEYASRSLRLRLAGGFGLTAADLQEFLVQNPDGHLRETAKRQLQRIVTARAPFLAAGWASLGAGIVLAVGGAAAWLHQHPGWPHWDEALPRLTAAAGTPGHKSAEPALAALRRLGPAAAGEVPALARALPELPREQQLALVQTWGYMGPAAIEPLGEVARNDDEEMALRAVQSLGVIGPAAAPALVEALDVTHEPVRQAARTTLLGFGAELVQPLLDTLEPANAGRHIALVRQADAYWHLRSSGNPYFAKVVAAQPLLDTIQSGEARAIEAAAQNLVADLGPAAAVAIPYLVERLTDEDRFVRELTLRSLGRIDSNWSRCEGARLAVPMLIQGLEVMDTRVRVSSAGALGLIGPPAAEAVPALLPLLHGGSENVREAAVFALGEIGVVTPEVTAALVERLNDTAPNVRRAAVTAVAQIGPPAASILVKQLENENWWMYSAAAQALCQMGPVARDAVPHLTKRLADGNWQVRLEVTKALGHLGPLAVEAVPTLVKHLKDEREEVREGVFTVLGQLGDVAADAIPALVVTLGDYSGNGNARLRATAALKQIDEDWLQSPRVQEALPVLIKQLEHKDRLARRAAAEALAQIGPAAAEASTALVKRLGDQDSEVRSAAATALGALQRDTAVPSLVERLSDSDWLVRKAAVEALGQLGPGAAGALPALMERRRDSSLSLRSSVLRALSRIDPNWRERLPTKGTGSK